MCLGEPREPLAVSSHVPKVNYAVLAARAHDGVVDVCAHRSPRDHRPLPEAQGSRGRPRAEIPHRHIAIIRDRVENLVGALREAHVVDALLVTVELAQVPT
eukprot:Amastigsp_a512715_21.p4 type:complete len:101 gc:universal Amastigsp_a512715_21:807-1109(+)